MSETINYDVNELATNLELFKQSINSILKERKDAIDKYESLNPDGVGLLVWRNAKNEITTHNYNLAWHIVDVFQTKKCTEQVLLYGINVATKVFQDIEDKTPSYLLFLTTLQIEDLSDLVLSKLVNKTFVNKVDYFLNICQHKGLGILTKIQMLIHLSNFKSMKIDTFEDIIKSIFSDNLKEEEIKQIIEKGNHMDSETLEETSKRIIMHPSCTEENLHMLVNSRPLCVEDIRAVLNHKNCSDRIIQTIIDKQLHNNIDHVFTLLDLIVTKTHDSIILKNVKNIVLQLLGPNLSKTVLGEESQTIK